jgi:hypothetical protein
MRDERKSSKIVGFRLLKKIKYYNQIDQYCINKLELASDWLDHGGWVCELVNVFYL